MGVYTIGEIWKKIGKEVDFVNIIYIFCILMYYNARLFAFFCLAVICFYPCYKERIYSLSFFLDVLGVVVALLRVI